MIYRKDPVSMTGLKRRRGSTTMRRPKTTQEKKWACAHRQFVRAKRGLRGLPDAWDDILHGFLGNNSWKRFRKTQYKMKAEI